MCFHTALQIRNENVLDKLAHISSSAQIHEILTTQSCKPDEKFCEYFLVMKEITQRGNIDDASLIHCVINGIPDTPNNKAILFVCYTLTELKKPLQIYQQICDQISKFHQPKSPSTYYITRRNQRDKSTKNICFNCGVSDHLPNESTFKDQVKG